MIAERVLSCAGLSLKYRTRSGEVWALQGVSFQAQNEEILAIVGPSGCGKTTLLKLIAGLLQPTSGRVQFSGAAPVDRPRAALIFQEHALLPWMTVRRNVELGLEMRQLDGPTRTARAESFLERVGLEAFGHAYPHELSVGMRQRVALARAFVAGSPILLMDEPFASLDAQTHRILRADLLSLWRQDRKLILYVTHDIEEAVAIGDRVLVLSGRPGRAIDMCAVPEPRAQELDEPVSHARQELIEYIWSSLEGDIRVGLQSRSEAPGRLQP